MGSGVGAGNAGVRLSPLHPPSSYATAHDKIKFISFCCNLFIYYFVNF